MIKTIVKIIILMVLALCTTALSETQRMYAIGNSLSGGMGFGTDSWDKRKMFTLFVNSGPHAVTIDKTIIAGAPLNYTWSFGQYTNLTAQAPWDVLTLQPYDRMLVDGAHTPDWGDVLNAKNFIQYALTNSPNIQPYVYSHWPSIPNHLIHQQYIDQGYTWEEAEALRQQAMVDFQTAGGFDGHWNTLYTDPLRITHNRTRDFFEQLQDTLNVDRLLPGDPIHDLSKDVLMIPVGDVLYELSQRLKSNATLLPKAAGGYYTDVSELIMDGTHLLPGAGRLISAAAWYATLFGTSPAGLDYTTYNDPDLSSGQYYDWEDPYYEEITADFAAAVYDATWDVVSTHSRAGVANADADSDGLPDWWETQYFGGATNANPAATASNGVNPVEDAYIAGISPIDPDAFFRISTLSPLASDSILEWLAAYGRSYTIYWTSNLLSGFGDPLTNNIIGGTFTDTTHGAENEGFYKIEVRLK